MEHGDLNTFKLKKIYELYKLLEQDVILSYTGTFDYHVLSVIAKNINLALQEYNIETKKIYRILIELAQNIGYYSAEYATNNIGKRIGSGIVLMKQSKDAVVFVTGNLIHDRELSIFLKKSHIINALDKEGLRELKRHQLTKPDSKYGGANIGLIQAALISSNPLRIDTISLDNNTSFLVIGVTIDKN